MIGNCQNHTAMITLHLTLNENFANPLRKHVRVGGCENRN